MGYKKDDPCIQKAFDDKRLFVLMTRDETAPEVVIEWIKLNIHKQPEAKLREAFDCAMEMRRRRVGIVQRKLVNAFKENHERFSKLETNPDTVKQTEGNLSDFEKAVQKKQGVVNPPSSFA